MESISEIALNHKLSLKNTGWMKKAVFDMENIDESHPLNNLSNKNQLALSKLGDIPINQIIKPRIKN
jgi:hypothetical protein